MGLLFVLKCPNCYLNNLENKLDFLVFSWATKFWTEDLFEVSEVANNAVSVFIVFYDFASDCTTEPQGTTFQQFKQLFMMGSKEPHDEQ